MTRRMLRRRLAGVMLLAGSAASTVIHRDLYAALRHGPPRPVEALLTLTSFALAVTGLYLLIAGGWRFDRSGAHRASARRAMMAPPPGRAALIAGRGAAPPRARPSARLDPRP